jgi:hypothetical protein
MECCNTNSYGGAVASLALTLRSVLLLSLAVTLLSFTAATWLWSAPSQRMPGEAGFSLTLRQDGRKLLVIGNNSLSHDLRCDYEVKLGMGRLEPEDRRPSDVQSMDTRHGRLALNVSDETLSSIAMTGLLLPEGSVDRVLDSRQFRADIKSAELTRYGCRPR